MPHLALELVLLILAAFVIGCIAGCVIPGLFSRSAGGNDNLQIISGVGEGLERTLNDNGVTRFAQIAAWTRADIDEFDRLLKFRGRIVREKWIEQAKLLAKGRFGQFEKEYGTGGLIDPETGKSRPGAKTRRS